MDTNTLLNLWLETRTRFSNLLVNLTEADLPKKLGASPNSAGLKTPVCDNFQWVEIPNYEWKPELKNDFTKTDILNKGKSKCN